MLLNLARAGLLVALVIAVTACTSGYDAVGSTVTAAMGRVLPEAIRPTQEVPAANLDPRFRYLRATVPAGFTYLALGYELQEEARTVEVWYSGTGEVVKLDDGRLGGASALFTEWRKVDLSQAPSWTEAVRASGPLTWGRTRDVMPGYRYGVEDRMTLKRAPVPKKTKLLDVNPAQLIWFEETTSTMRGAEVPPAIYGVEMQGDKVQVVYSEQCVAVDFCLTLQKWPARQ